MWVGPWLLPRALAFFRSIQASNRPGQIRPLPTRVKLGLNALFVFIVICLIQTIPNFSPPNIYKDTQSRLAIPTSVLFNRLSSIRNDNLTPLDLALKDRYFEASTDFGLIYAAYGPQVMAECIWCNTKEPTYYLYYAIPSILAPHLLHVLIILCLTSTFFTGSEGSRWRFYGVMATASLALVEVVLVARNDWRLNTTKRLLADVDFFYWRMRTYRLLAFALLDSLLGWAVWLTSTNRWLVKPPGVSQQVEFLANTLKVPAIKMSLLSRMQAAVVSDEQLLTTGMRYWTQEPRNVAELEQEREVVDAKRLALSRINIDKIRHEANLWVDQVWRFFQPPTQDGLRPKTE
jgi:hypothetical protein